MTIKELAEQLDIKTEILFDFLEHINEEFERREDFVLTTDQLEKAKTSKEQFDQKKVLHLKEKFSLSDNDLVQELMDANEVEYFMLTGEYHPLSGKNFGFFKEIEHVSGKVVSDPFGNRINSVFIPNPGDLEAGLGYIFRPTISRKSEREKKADPYLLQTNYELVQRKKKINHLYKALTDLKEVNAHLEQDVKKNAQEILAIQDNLAGLTEEYKRRKSLKEKELQQEVSQLMEEKEKEVNHIIDEYNQEIEKTYEEVQESFALSQELKEQVVDLEINLGDLKKKEKVMEETVQFLKSKVKTCHRLEFLSESDSERYLSILDSNGTFDLGDRYLDFETDLSGSVSALARHIQKYLYHKRNLIYTDFQIRNFLALLMTNDLVVLSGLSGSGKTQIVKSFAEAVGGVAKIIPVKPNWMSSEDLLGYYNPIQNSFLPTPFTEAIVEAIQNPNRLYLICLDEMNLARVEYYFADFLSKLEEREAQPTIELYAQHEEELFLSEFKTLLNLTESAIGEQEIHSWTEFLNNDNVRERFFKLLGKVDKDSVLQIHAKMKRRLLDILKFPSTITIPENIRFIGAINVDETTHYFSPKILDRVHVIKFDNPLLVEDIVRKETEDTQTENLNPVYVNPIFFGKRSAYPSLAQNGNEGLVQKLKQINKDFLLKLSIDFGIRSIRQALQYWHKLFLVMEGTDHPGDDIAFNAIVNQKILSRFLLDSSETLPEGKSKNEVLKELAAYLKDQLSSTLNSSTLSSFFTGPRCYDSLERMILSADQNNGQLNYWIISSTEGTGLNDQELKEVDEDEDNILPQEADKDLPF